MTTRRMAPSSLARILIVGGPEAPLRPWEIRILIRDSHGQHVRLFSPKPPVPTRFRASVKQAEWLCGTLRAA